MIDFIEYVVSELKSKRLTKSNALALIKQFSRPAPAVNGCVLHPLLHCNTSDLSQQSYRSTFSGEEFFLRDHQIQGKKVLPAVAYLEMGRAAVAQALPDRGSTIELRNIAWAQPIVADGRTEVMLALFASEESSGTHDQVEVEIYGAEEVVHFQAQAVLGGTSAPARRDLSKLQEQMTKARLDAAQLYATISGVGIDLGAAHRGVSVIHVGEQQLLAYIRRPDVVDETHDQYVLHPSVMDSALQAGMSLVIGSTAGAPPIPFALESLRIFGNVGKDMLAWVRYSAGSKRDDKVIKLDIDLCDEEGNVRVQMLGFSSRVLSADLSQPKVRKEATGCLLALPVWQAMPASAATDVAAFVERHVVLCDFASVDVGRLDGQCVELRTSADASLADRYTDVALSCFERVQGILKSKPQGRVLLQVVAPNDADDLLLAGLSGMLKTAAQENPKLVGQIIFTERSTSTDELIRQLSEAAQTSEQVIKYVGGGCQVIRWQEVRPSEAPAELAFKEHGVYLITGGLGGLGVLFAKEILAQTASAKVILTGRSTLTPDKQAKLADLGAEGRVFYRELDLTDLDQGRQVIASSVSEFGQLNGIIHSAGMVADNFIFKKAADELRAVFAPKVTGTFNLDQASSGVDLDFLALFSSGVSAFGNAGQADYAAANGFLDEFAVHRNRLVAANARRGLTISLNWPLWQEGGMRVDGANKEMLQRSAGMCPMHTAVGMQAFHRSLELQQSQVLVVEGELELMRRALLNDVTTRPEARPALSEVNSGDLLEKTEDYLRQQFSTVLKLAVHRIDPQAPLEKYGIDSILAMDLTGQLERSFGSLPKTLFFEYQTIRELSAYFVREYTAKIASLLTSKSQAPVEAESIKAAPAQRSVKLVKASKRFLRRGAAAPTLSVDPIAIVGLSGRYPEAIDVEAYWRNLRDGRDCIVEVPKQRWDWREYFSEDRTAEGRHYSKWGGFISGVDEFDPLFFNIPPVDAELIDPQERLFLQHAWMAVEDAGYTRASLRAPHADGMPGQVGVYVGVMYGEYQIFGAEASLQGKRIGVPVSYASIANRVSYVFNLHGPSMTLDTMCSSSLTAIHLACQDLKQGRTNLAIAGGVNVTVHPNKYLILSAGQFISSDGHCQSFGEGGDGYIPGEGVGVVVLKRLSEAQRDGNHIYGVIKGSALNHGGKTNGYSVPNPQAQANVIAQAFKEYGVDARHVSYIEAHGTGTKLGDPIEIAALTQVFRQHTAENQFCAIGSAKSNIGHCESAAGIAGLTKVLLQMKHQQIAPSLHSATLNPHINFEKSPFVVNQTLRHWEQPEVDGRRWPRLAGISSFGAGGSNAHLIVEEYSPPQREFDGPGGQVIIPLSARTAEQLKQKARELLAFIRTHEDAIDIASLAYTLQVGREPMSLRLSFFVDSIEQLADKLEAYDRDELNIDQCFHGEVGQGVDGMSLLNQDEDMLEAIDKWIARKKFSKLADLWVKGLELDWRKLYGERKPALVSLPTYPFAKDRYWAGRHVDRSVSSRAGAAALHPLLHTNTSDFYQQSYASVFTGQEFFLADHQVVIDDATRKMLPAVAYLEMVRAAVELALPSQDGPRSLELKNVAWAQPLIVDSEAKVSVALLSQGEDTIDFEVCSTSESAEADIIHCQGRVDISAVAASSVLDVQSLKARMSRGTMSAQKIYDAFASMGIHYGPAFQAIAGIQQGRDELVAELVLPSAVGIESGRYSLHPSLLDSALQAALGLIADIDDLPRRPAIPFALDSLRILAPCASRMFAWVRYSAGAAASQGITKVDIDLCDSDGRICAQLSGLTSRVLMASDAKIGSLLAHPVWEVSTAVSETVSYQRHHVLLCSELSVDAAQLEASMPGVKVEHFAVSGATSIAERYRAAALACFERLQIILQAKPTGRHLFQVVVGREGEGALFVGLSGLIRTARLENPQIAGQVILTSNKADAAALAAQLQVARGRPGEALLKFEGTTPSVLKWQSQAVQAVATQSFKDRGVYLITGGLGGLGLLFAQEIFARTQDATVIFTGRAVTDDGKRAVLNRLATECRVSPHQLAYRQLDLTQLAPVEALIRDVVNKFARIDGVLHSAGMIRDGFIVNKTAAEFSDVLAPKVDGAMHLDLATRDLDLDFLVLFSSVAAATGNVGQADYATANAFMDEFASYRNRLVSAGTRRGRTLSINWPLWEAGGMQLDADARDMLRRASGTVPLKTSTGMAAFHQGMGLPAGQVLVVEGHVEQLLKALSGRGALPQKEASRSDATVTVDAGKLLEKARSYLGQQFASLLKIPAHEVDAKAPLEKYGIDSVLAMKFTNQLERTFGSLSKTLLFEYQTIASLAGYLVKAFPAILQQQTGVSAGAQTKVTAPVAAAKHTLVPMKRGGSRLIAPAVQANDDVAIIGVSGKYPQADNLAEFWDNLKNGRDCITEVPSDRWDHSRFFHPSRNQAGKTYSKWGGFLGGVDQFDPLFFNISPKEAELIDPQERLFLETVWETIEDAGYSKDSIAANRVGVFVGVMWGQYELFGAASAQAGVPSSSFASIANRVSYFFDFHGPSLALDTMCSSSLTAIHLASEEVRKGAVDVAIAGGVNVSIHPNKYLSLAQGNFASTDGRCRSFGQGGDGYVPGEGVGAVLLKPLAKALEDGDQVYAIIKGSSINHGGKTNGYTVPNPVAQSQLIVDTLDKAKIDPATLSYIEAHGTGTSLGDPIEITGLLKAFEGSSMREQRCPIGSVKSNIGHLESAAGIAAITKVLLQLKHQQLVPSLHAQPANPHLDFESTPFYVQTTLQEWKRHDNRPHRVGVSSFGAGGSNAHVILEEFVDARPKLAMPARPEAFVLSAKNRESLLAYARKVIQFLGQDSESSLAEIAFTSQVGRTPMPERLVIIASSKDALRGKLAQWLQEPRLAVEDLYEGNTRSASSNSSSLIEGEAGEAFLRLTLQQRDLAKLAKLWIYGVEIDWSLLHAAASVKRVSLPTYPFQKERYWINADLSLPAAAALTTDPGQQKQLRYYRPAWRASDVVRASGSLTTPVLIMDVSDQLCVEFRRQCPGQAVVLVKLGDSYQQLGEDTFSVNVADEQDFVQLIEGLKARNLLPGAIVHRWVGDDQVSQCLEHGVFALHQVCKALLKQKPKNAIRIVSLGVDPQAPLHSALGGYFKTLVLENPKFTGKVVALSAATSIEATVQRLVDELVDANSGDREVSYRSVSDGGARRLVRALERYIPAAIRQSVVKQHGVYLITGGLGGLGYIFAEHLIRNYHAKLVLLGRSTPSGEQQRRLDDLRAYSDDVLYLQTDVFDREQVEETIREIKRRFARIDGVIHSAGVHRDSFVMNKTRDEMQTVLAAKVMGAINLDLATRDESLDMFVLFSSVAGVLGNAGQSDYAFANSFLDAFAEQRKARVQSGERSGRTLSIDWPFWQDGGMTLSASDIELVEQRAGISPLPTKKGIECWETLLQADVAQGVVLYGEPSKVDAYVLGQPAQVVVRDALPILDTETLAVETQRYLAALLGEQIKLPVDRIDPQERFESFGVDSMMIARINAQLERDLGELPKTLFYENATIEELAAYLTQEARPRLAKMLGTSVAPVTMPSEPLPPATSEAKPHEQPLAQQSVAAEPVAIIGVHGYFPQSDTLAEYWDHLKNGRDLIGDVPANRWHWQDFFDADPDHAKDGKIYCKSGGFLADFDKFDAPFFSIPAEDARLIDPQERLFLQSVWAAIEDAGYTRESLKQRHPKAKSADVGVFGGVTTNSYHQLTTDEWNRGNMVTPGAMPWSIVNRVSYVFDFQGPSMPVDTACSSSLVAIHLACESLKRKECQVAIAGGVNLYLHPSKYQSLCRRRMLAVEGKCRSFGAGDDGFIPGEGVGTLVLKPLRQAKADGDHIYGVIAASAYEHSGRSNGYSAPNPNSQAQLIDETLRKANIHPDTIGYVEGHGTGTQLGDSLEIVSLSQAFRRQTQQTQFCPVGSVKANVGHSESAAGIAGVAKILLQFKHQKIAPTIHSRNVNPNIDFASSPFYLQHELTAWKAPERQPRRAMINSFGAGGVNACLILEDHEQPRLDRGSDDKRPHLVVLSAKNLPRLRESAERLKDYLLTETNVDLTALAYTLQVGREAMDERLTVIAASADDLLDQLNLFLANTPCAQVAQGRVEVRRKKKALPQPERERIRSEYLSGELSGLAQRWLEGQDIDWNDTYEGARPRKVSLPTYPFAKDRHWVSDALVGDKRVTSKQQPVQLHPLVTNNVSTLRETCFASLLSDEQYYARDHKVNGEMFFPGAGFLEMACVNGAIAGEQAVSSIRDIVWIQPLRLTGGNTLVKTFLKANGNSTDYVIVSFNEDNERVVHSEGRLLHGADRRPSNDAIAIADLKQRGGKSLQGAMCYREFEKFGFRYGPSFRTIQELYVGSNFALSKLRLAPELNHDFEQYILHPCLIDGALQTVIGIAGEAESDTPYLPFALDEVEILRPLPETCYAYVELATSEHSSRPDIKQFNIRLLNEAGDALVKLNNFYVRALVVPPAGRHGHASSVVVSE